MKALLKSEAIVAALVGALVTAIFTQWVSRYKAEADVELVDLAFVDDPRVARIDIKLRNIGERIAFLRELRAEVEHIWSLDPLLTPHSLYLSGAEYTVVLPVMRTPYAVSTPISQAIQPNDVDRFGVVLQSQDGPNESGHHFFLVRLTLLYNETGTVRATKPLLIASGPRENLEMMYVRPLMSKEALDAFIPPEARGRTRMGNLATISDVARHDALRNPLATKLIRLLSLPQLSNQLSEPPNDELQRTRPAQAMEPRR